MSQKKRGLGRGLGALIPQGPPQDKPVDVFFPQRDEEDVPGAVLTAPDDERSGEEKDGRSEPASAASPMAGDRPGRRTASWDSAIAGGRLSINGSLLEGLVRCLTVVDFFDPAPQHVRIHAMRHRYR